LKKYSKYIQVFLLLILLFNLSCAKQEAPTIEGSEARTQREIDRLEACSLVNFNKGVLLHRNMIFLFKCTLWEQEFPKMYQAITRIQGSSWDHVIGPIDQEFVSNLARRDRVFKNIKELDSKEGLDDLSRVLVALNETNFFDSVKSMFKCVENSSEAVCLERLGHIPTKESLKNIVKLIDTKPETIEHGSNFVKKLNVAIGPHEEALRVEINKFKQDPMYINLRLKLVDAFSTKVRAGLSKEDREFLGKVLLTGSSKENVPWIYTWIHDAKMTRDKFKDLVEYPVLTNPIFVGEIKGLKQAYDEGFNCTIKSTSDANDLINFDFKTHMAEFVSILRKRDYKGYYDYSSSAVAGLKMSSEICKELESNKHNVNFLGMMTNLSSFLGEKKFYDLVKFLALNTTAKGDLDKTFAENLYLFDLIASELFSSANGVNDQIIKRTREFYPVIYDVVQNLPPEAYVHLGEMLQDFLKEENDDKFKGVVSFWDFFNPTEKNFVFNFVDRHFEGDTQYVLLFDFYTKFLDDLREVQPVFKESWMGSEAKEEMSYLALQDFFYQLDGKETLQDFQKFFGRDQILKVLEVISNGSNIHAMAKSELAYLRSNDYLAQAKSEPYKFQVVYNQSIDADYNSAPVIECMKIFADVENGFYQLVRKLPEMCTKVTNENVAFRMFGWLNTIENKYKEFLPGSNSGETILDQKGILSPYLLNTVWGTAKILDSILGDIDSKLPTKNGIPYLTTSAKYHLHTQKASLLIDKNLAWLTKWFDVLPEKNVIHRNAVLKSFTREENFARANDVTRSLAGLSVQYSDWVKQGNLEKTKKRSFGQYDPNQDCDKVVNQFVSKYPCPSKEIVKKHSDEILKYLTVIWEKPEGSAISHLLKSIKPGEGLDIPLDGKKTKKYRLTLKETFKYLYDSSDKAFPINKTKTYFVNENGKSSNELLTTLERIEVVIREVRFDNNYLGVAFLNAITKAEDYNDEAENRKGLLSKCLKIPGIRCSRPMSDDDLRRARNALQTFDSLIDINNGNGKDARLNYGNFLKTFEQTLVGSSAKEAQDVQLLALKNEHLLQHNGRLLGDMTAMTMWSNTARVIRDRVGRTREEFNKFVESPEFNRVNNSILYGFDLPQAVPSAERLLKKVKAIPNGEKQNMMGHTIDWVASLDYQQTRLFEDTVARLLLVGSYLGTPDVVFSAPSSNETFARYKNNNLLQIFLALEKVIDYYPTLKNYFPGDVKLIDAFKPLNNFLVFFTESLGSTNVPEKNIAYVALNEIFNAAQMVIFDELSDPRFATLNGQTAKGLDLLIDFLQKPNQVAQTYQLVREDYRYLDVLHANQGSWFKAVGQNLGRITNSERIDLRPVRDYLNFTTKSAICLNRDSECISNFHFDEMANLVKFLNKTNEKGETYFTVASNTLLVENFDQLNTMISDLLPALRIKEVRPPLK
jgi:hypothetical protein